MDNLESNVAKISCFLPEQVRLQSSIVVKPFQPLGWQPPAMMGSHVLVSKLK